MKLIEGTKKFFIRNTSTVIGYVLLLHWVLLVIDRIANNMLYNLVWVSHIALLLAAIGFLIDSDLLLTGSLVSVIIVHSIWIYDFVILIFTGSTALDFVSYLFELSLYRKILTIHHLYLIPLLLFWLLWKRRKINLYGWLVASGLFFFATLTSLLFLPREYNVNCAHFVCNLSVQLFPFLVSITTLNSLGYFLFENGIMGFGFFIINMILYWILELGSLRK